MVYLGKTQPTVRKPLPKNCLVLPQGPAEKRDHFLPPTHGFLKTMR